MALLYKIRRMNLLYLFLDVAAFVASYKVAGAIESYPDIRLLFSHDDVIAALVFSGALLAVFYLLRVYRVMWEYSTLGDFYRLIGAIAAGFAIFVLIVIVTGIPLSGVAGLLSLFLVCAMTLSYRIALRDIRSRRLPEGSRGAKGHWGEEGVEEKRILIAGAGEAGRMIQAEYLKRSLDRQIIGFVDDDAAKIGKTLGGKTVLGSTRDMRAVIEAYRINELIIAMPSVPAVAVDRVIRLVKAAAPRIPIRTLPSFTRIFDTPISPDLRELGIADIIGREEFSVDTGAIREHFSGKTVLVTGAGGSIGSELCRQLLRFNIRRLVAVGRGEFSIYNLARSLDETLRYLGPKVEAVYRIADVKDLPMLRRIFTEYRPHIVFHAAAHKHVPLMEYNEIEAVQNNVAGSMNVFEASMESGVGECVLVSTDKAVRPTSVMGASKRLAELVALYYHREKKFKVSIVRFGNVIGSRGSVIPLFREQIERGGPLTVTHPEVKRYFMSIPEASLLVINAAAYTMGGELFVLDMGKQYRVVDVARTLIRLYGLEPERDIKIVYTGLRPGEKLYEELFYDRERLLATRNEKIFILNPQNDNLRPAAIEAFMRNTLSTIARLPSRELRGLIRDIVPEYEFESPPEDGAPQRLIY